MPYITIKTILNLSDESIIFDAVVGGFGLIQMNPKIGYILYKGSKRSLLFSRAKASSIQLVLKRDTKEISYLSLSLSIDRKYIPIEHVFFPFQDDVELDRSPSALCLDSTALATRYRILHSHYTIFNLKQMLTLYFKHHINHSRVAINPQKQSLEMTQNPLNSPPVHLLSSTQLTLDHKYLTLPKIKESHDD